MSAKRDVTTEASLRHVDLVRSVHSVRSLKRGFYARGIFEQRNTPVKNGARAIIRNFLIEPIRGATVCVHISWECCSCIIGACRKYARNVRSASTRYTSFHPRRSAPLFWIDRGRCRGTANEVASTARTPRPLVPYVRRDDSH